MTKQTAGYDVTAIQKMFRDYVDGLNCAPRHTQEAIREVGLFSTFVAGMFPMNVKAQNCLYDHMMSCAVEFEESGFIAGFLYALSRLQAPTSEAGEDPTSNTAKDEKTPPGPIQVNREQIRGHSQPNTQDKSAYITSRQIAEMFETPNSKVTKRIECDILPNLDEQSRKNFEHDVFINVQKRRFVYYRLNRVACEIYIKAMEPYKKYVSITAGMAKMRAMMKSMFPAESAAS